MNNTVGTTKAAFLLNISVSRVKVLLQQNRIKGATKSGRVWKGSCRVVYQPDNPLPCGAVVWIEVVPDNVVIPQLLISM